ncbi:MAG: radical SAM protein [Deltaproteobacteria bacterium]|nr:radical SAM protein [Deltaproteobacteria bacterium]MBW2415477.1 radical SAM protein [Deltaproteobacteria bacterium]
MKYVYAVVSRRAGGVSVGVNLNPNNACNWRCVYCQVPGLVRGAAPRIDLDLLESELRELLGDIRSGSFMQARVPVEARRLRDLAFSGNGEPTSSPQLAEAIDRVAAVRDELGLREELPLVLITNGSLLGRPDAQRAITRLAAHGGEVWFKLDRATAEGLASVSSTPVDPVRHLARLRDAAAICPTRIQTCMFERNGEAPDADEIDAWVDALRTLVADGVSLRGVLLYGLARPSLQPEAGELDSVSPDWLERLAARVESLGLSVQIST